MSLNFDKKFIDCFMNCIILVEVEQGLKLLYALFFYYNFKLVPSFFYDASFFTKFGINLMLRRLNSQTLVNTTIYNYLWNFSDPILDVAQQVAPFMVPTKNMGVLDMVKFCENSVAKQHCNCIYSFTVNSSIR